VRGVLSAPAGEAPRPRMLALAILQSLAVVAIAYVIGTESFLIGGAIALVGLAVVVLIWPTAALPSLVALYVIPPTFSVAGGRPRDVVAGCFAVLILEWLRSSVVSPPVLVLLMAAGGFFAAILVSAMGHVTQPGMTASLAEVGAGLVILAAGICLGATRGIRPPLTFVRVLVSGVALAALVLWFGTGGDLGGLGAVTGESRASSVFDNPNFLGTFLAIGAVVLVAGGTTGPSRLASIAAFGLCVAGIAVSGSRGALLVVAAGLACLILVRRRRTIRVLLAGAVIASLVAWGVVALTTARVSGTRRLGISASSIENSSELRLNAARLAVDLVVAHPLTGVGYNQFPRYAARDARLNVEFDPHNEYLRIGAESGLVALTLLVVLIGTVVWHGVRFARRGGGPAAAAAVAAVAAYGIALLTVQGLRSFQFSAPWLLLAGVIVGAAAREANAPGNDSVSADRTRSLDRKEEYGSPTRFPSVGS